MQEKLDPIDCPWNTRGNLSWSNSSRLSFHLVSRNWSWSSKLIFSLFVSSHNNDFILKQQQTNTWWWFSIHSIVLWFDSSVASLVFHSKICSIVYSCPACIGRFSGCKSIVRVFYRSSHRKDFWQYDIPHPLYISSSNCKLYSSVIDRNKRNYGTRLSLRS